MKYNIFSDNKQPIRLPELSKEQTKELIYWIGIYSICVTIHEGFGFIVDSIINHKKKSSDKQKQKTKNKIGF